MGWGDPGLGLGSLRLSVRIPHTLNERLSVPVLCWQLASKGPVTVIMTVAVVVVKQKEGVSRQQCCDCGHTQVPAPPSWFLENIIAGNFLWPTQ